MSKKRVPIFYIIIFLLIVFLSACNMPSTSKETQDTSGLIHTVAAKTVKAQLTSDAAESGEPSTDPDNSQDGSVEELSPSATPSQTEALSPTETPFPTPSDTPAPSPTNTPIPCDQISFVSDITIPDGTVMVPGQKFNKIWRLKNTGSCTWTSGYSVVFSSGEAMGAPAAIQLTTGTVAPGGEFDVSLDLEAPVIAGTHRADFKLRNTNGIVFGLGDKSGPFFVEIKVEVGSGVMLDFIARADEATWGSGTGTITYTMPGEIAIPYAASVAGTDAYVSALKNVKLEGGNIAGAILETRPDNNGYIIGRFPEYIVGTGDYINAKLGFLAEGDGSCGAGDVVFQISYTKGNDLTTITSLGSWSETCDGTYRKINIDLSALKGEKVHFYLIILSNGASTDDKAIWDSLGVMR